MDRTVGEDQLEVRLPPSHDAHLEAAGVLKEAVAERYGVPAGRVFLFDASMDERGTRATATIDPPEGDGDG